MLEAPGRGGTQAPPSTHPSPAPLHIHFHFILPAAQRENRPPFVLFAKKTAPQQGTKVVARGRIINNQPFVATVYEQGSEIIAESYHALSSTKLTTRLLLPALQQWYREEYFDGNRADELSQQVRVGPPGCPPANSFGRSHPDTPTRFS